jgi:hypothetical protein
MASATGQDHRRRDPQAGWPLAQAAPTGPASRSDVVPKVRGPCPRLCLTENLATTRYPPPSFIVAEPVWQATSELLAVERTSR